MAVLTSGTQIHNLKKPAAVSGEAKGKGQQARVRRQKGIASLKDTKGRLLLHLQNPAESSQRFLGTKVRELINSGICPSAGIISWPKSPSLQLYPTGVTVREVCQHGCKSGPEQADLQNKKKREIFRDKQQIKVALS